ncbi:MAG: methylmalonyl Co-A mutase-associated GTPase MeaB [Bacteroidota bacterium]
MARPAVDLDLLTQGSPRAIARAISLVENDDPAAIDLLNAVFPLTGRSHRIGITGPPGAGKSTLTNALAQLYRRKGLEVGIIAVDPTSPFTGGALLGDRVRMADVELDPGVFIRSMASRGSLGGLSRKTAEAADVLDAAGKQIVFMETVGVGQSELDIAGAADTTIVVLVPESGDSIQAMKAGLMEIADLFVLNKSDRAGADQAVMALQMILHFRGKDRVAPEVLKTVAKDGTGIEEVVRKIDEHRLAMESGGLLVERRRKRLEDRIQTLVSERLRVDFWNPARKTLLRQKVNDAFEGRSTPYEVALQLLNDYRASSEGGKELPWNSARS